MKRKTYKKIEYLEDRLKVSLDRPEIAIKSDKASSKWILLNSKGHVVAGTRRLITNVLAVIYLIVIFLFELPFLLIGNLIILFQSILYGVPFEIVPILLAERRIGCIDNKIRIDIRHREHAPPHFHVIIDDSDYSISILTGELIQGEIKNKGQRTAIKEWYDENRQLLIKTWNESRPSDCPVGKINETDTNKV